MYPNGGMSVPRRSDLVPAERLLATQTHCGYGCGTADLVVEQRYRLGRFGRPLLDIRGAAGFAILGTILGPHVIRDGERPALL
jgi:hypothetical protein